MYQLCVCAVLVEESGFVYCSLPPFWGVYIFFKVA